MCGKGGLVTVFRVKFGNARFRAENIFWEANPRRYLPANNQAAQCFSDTGHTAAPPWKRVENSPPKKIRQGKSTLERQRCSAASSIPFLKT